MYIGLCIDCDLIKQKLTFRPSNFFLNLFLNKSYKLLIFIIIMGFWPVVLNVLKNSDIIILIADARMPEITKNSEIIRKAELMNKKIILVYNKVDLISKKDFEDLKNKGDFFISCISKRGVNQLREFLENYGGGTLRVGIVGYPNTGKSSLINLLTRSNEKVSHISGTTKKTKWIRTGRLRIMDSPGVIPFSDSSSKAAIASAKDAHKIKNPENVALKIIDFLLKKNKKIIENFYQASGNSSYDIFLKIGKKKGYLLKKGEIDERRTAIKIIEDWQRGKISMNI